MRARQTQHIGLGLRANLAQFSLLVGVNALVGGMTGQERTVLPLLAEDRFGLDGITATMTFILAFGIVKAVANFSAGALADRFGRKPILIAGWLFGIPVPLLLIWAPTWAWVVFANGLLGINQGLCWSTTVIMKINLVGSRNRGLAMGLNEAAGYLAVSLTALLTGLAAARSGLSPEPFFFGLAYAGLGLGLSVIGVRETRQHARLEAQNTKSSRPDLPLREVFALTTIRDRSLSAVTQAGLVNNLNDGMAWGLLPIFYAANGLGVAQIGILAAAYPAVWGLGQLVTGAWSDRIGRKPLIVAGMFTQAVAIGGIAVFDGFLPWLAASAVLGISTALVYPTLLAAVGDKANPRWRASAVGVYRFWRDAGFAIGALLVGAIADLTEQRVAIWTVALLTAASGVVVSRRMGETLSRTRTDGQPE